MKTLLEISALILGLINGLILVWYFLRDHPKLVVDPIHPEVYQWYFRLPDGEYEMVPTRRFGFILYVGIANKGLRDVGLSSWGLRIKTQHGKPCKLHPLNLPSEPMATLKETGAVKIWPVLGQGGMIPTSGELMIVSGGSISGMAFYIYECYGNEEWNPRKRDEIVIGKFRVKSVLGNKASARIPFHEKPLEEIEKMIPDIGKMDAGMEFESVLEDKTDVVSDV